MKSLDSGRYAVSVSVAAAMLAGCGGSQPPMSGGAIPQAPALAARTSSTTYKVVYSFGAVPDGNYPDGGVINVNGTLYGTTYGGGEYQKYGKSRGTIFSVSPSGMEKVLHSFGRGTDGAFPSAGLINVGGTLYGTTSKGGSHDVCGYSSYPFGCGTVFSVTTGGREKVLHSFGGSLSDGYDPLASLIGVKGALYGTTQYGGSYNGCGFQSCGTVFSITPSGTEKVVYGFYKVRDDGAAPVASLIKVNGMLYGTTQYGGTNDEGTVFSVTPSGTENVLHSFGGSTDGTYPNAGLVDVGGTLYGTTITGPGKCNGLSDCGTIFSITPSGTEKVLHSFLGGPNDGAGPVAPLIARRGKLYGTTGNGGQYCYGGCGTLFSMTLTGKVKVLHNFGSGTDGVYPGAGLIDVGGTLYGTTEGGGTNGNGTVFALSL